jgi:hypothetical protein
MAKILKGVYFSVEQYNLYNKIVYMHAISMETFETNLDLLLNPPPQFESKISTKGTLMQK